MIDPQIVVKMDTAVLQRLHPAVTRWNRLEGRPRTHHFDRALRAEVRDALWMLTKQWQMGEFQGDDAGSPVLARACIDVMTIDRFQAAQGPVEPLTLAAPLEATVERRPPPLRAGNQYLSLDLRLAVGRRWLKLLDREFTAGRLSADHRAGYRTRYAVPVPDPTSAADAAICAHPDAWQQVGAAAARAMDGIALFEHLDVPGSQVDDGIAGAAPDRAALTTLAERLRAWFRELIHQPTAEEPDAWLPERLEYQFGVSAQDGVALEGQGHELVMRAEEYSQGHLDWYALERRPEETRLGDPAQPLVTPERKIMTFLPAPIVFDGMPSTRWWAFEDRRTNFGEVKPDSTDLGKLLLMEFALVYANDWFVLPCTLPIGRVAEVKGIAISNVFGERFWIEPVREAPAADWSRWSLFTLGGPRNGPPNPPTAVTRVADPARLVLLPATPKIQESAAIEEAALIRDEQANLVWGIEYTIPLPTGAPRAGAEAAREYLQFLQRLAGDPPAPPAPAAPIRYRVMNTVPEQWIPFIPVHVEGSVREIQLQRAALPRILPNTPVEKIRPRTTLLRHNLPRKYFIHEEEVPRAGAVVRQSYQRTRWLGGTVFTWFGARKGTGRGEGSSGLRFDYLADVKT